MSRFDQILSWIENTSAALAFGGAAVLAILQVILRYGFGYVIFWSEEAIIYLIIYATFVGAVIVLRHNQHINVDILSVFLGERGKWMSAILASSITATYCAIIGGYAWLMITEPAAKTTTPALHWPLWVVQLAVPIGLTLMFIRSLEILYRTARHRRAFPEFEEAHHGEEEGV